MLTFAIILQFVLAICIAIMVMLQKSSSIGLGSYGSSNDTAFGAKGPADILVKITFGLSAALIFNTVFLTYQFSAQKNASITDLATQSTVAPTPSTNTAPSK